MVDKTARLPRRARVVENRLLCPSGTFRLAFEVIDDETFDFEPGQFVSLDLETRRLGYRRSPYCILTPPDGSRRFDLLVRFIPEGPVSVHLSSLEPGDVVSFGGPTGASMAPHDAGGDRDLVLLATGVGVSPFLSLVPWLARRGFDRRIALYWGLRRTDDLCLTKELD